MWEKNLPHFIYTLSRLATEYKMEMTPFTQFILLLIAASVVEIALWALAIYYTYRK